MSLQEVAAKYPELSCLNNLKELASEVNLVNKKFVFFCMFKITDVLNKFRQTIPTDELLNALISRILDLTKTAKDTTGASFEDKGDFIDFVNRAAFDADQVLKNPVIASQPDAKRKLQRAVDLIDCLTIFGDVLPVYQNIKQQVLSKLARMSPAPPGSPGSPSPIGGGSFGFIVNPELELLNKLKPPTTPLNEKLNDLFQLFLINPNRTPDPKCLNVAFQLGLARQFEKGTFQQTEADLDNRLNKVCSNVKTQDLGRTYTELCEIKLRLLDILKS